MATTAVISAAVDWTSPPPPLSTFDNPDYRDWLPNAEPSPATAQTLNSLGFDRYQESQLLDAALMWKAALLMDWSNPWAHYNYASVLALFATGHGSIFDGPMAQLESSAWDWANLYDYREAIIHHLKVSISLRPERLQRLQEDSDFDGIRRLEDYQYILMGSNPDVRTIISRAPDWYSTQPGAYLPTHTLVLSPDGSASFAFDMGTYRYAGETTERIDYSFTGQWTADGDQLTIQTDDGREYHGTFVFRFDDLGYLTSRKLVIPEFGPFGSADAHYWEGQDA